MFPSDSSHSSETSAARGLRRAASDFRLGCWVVTDFQVRGGAPFVVGDYSTTQRLVLHCNSAGLL